MSANDLEAMKAATEKLQQAGYKMAEIATATAAQRRSGGRDCEPAAR